MGAPSIPLLLSLGCHPPSETPREPSTPEPRCDEGKTSACPEADDNEHEATSDRAKREERSRADIVAVLRRHPWLWACARRAGGSPREMETLHITATRSGTITKVVLDSPLPERPELRACIHDVFSATTISNRYLEGSVEVRMELPLDPVIVGDLFAGAVDEGATRAMQRSVDAGDGHRTACPEDGRSTCERLPAKQLLSHGVWTPDPKRESLAQSYVPGTPTSLVIPIDFCVNQRTGETAHTRLVDTAPSTATAELLLDQIARWRFKPWSEAAAVCTRIHYDVRFKWRGSP